MRRSLRAFSAFALVAMGILAGACAHSEPGIRIMHDMPIYDARANDHFQPDSASMAVGDDLGMTLFPRNRAALARKNAQPTPNTPAYATVPTPHD